ncbi:asparagine--tRNA ligase [Candidatus Roseilinea sp. NK_OTU-006]|jgi:asparaginyl-tRNA synthetase|uniref:asparagine--tRNA ligase n=1 Tax=Candidatus Roseilinea sp. NK_OTU-006 TaxID=2704250 RepID=UPI00145E41B2|nr:asparagine--tRNA ligase [Candidatus Roseilinea sp. NK_OTU-006]
MHAPIVSIAALPQHVGQAVTLRGWLYNKTGKGKLAFLQVRDGTGICQCVVFRPNVGDEIFAIADKLPQESSLIVTGAVRADARAPGVPGGYELDVQSLEVVQRAEDYPIGPKEHGVEFLMDHRHLWIRSSRQWAVLRVRATVMRAIRAWLDGHGFIEVSTPILTPSAAEGTTNLFEVAYFDEKAYLAQTGQLYNEANIFAFGRVYCFGPTFRAEKSKTRRHLTEFWMVEPEIAFCDLEQLLEIEEQFVSYVVQTCLRENANELKLLGRDVGRLQRVAPPFPRITYDDAVRTLQEMHVRMKAGETVTAYDGTPLQGIEDPDLLRIEWGTDFGSPHETALTQLYDKPVFVTGFPSAVKAFYMEPYPDRPEVCKSADLLAPEGYGEIIGGSERISDGALLERRIREHGLPMEPYKWYVELRKYGSVPHSGFGLGVERTVAWICGIEHVREASPFPRLLNRLYP